MKSGKKSIISMVISLLIVLSSGTAAFAESTRQTASNVNTVAFTDVPSDHWAKTQIDEFTQQGIVNGCGDGTFRPNSGVTREEFSKVLVKTFNQPLEMPDTPTFSDVASNHWSFPYIETSKGFLTGYTNPFGGLPAFHPTEYATREDIAVALVRMMGFTEDDASDKSSAKWKFKDGSSISPSLLPYVSIAYEKGLINGYPDGNFGPQQGITRAETVALLSRATKQAVSDIKKELDLSASIAYSSDGKTATINIQAELGTIVKVNGETVKMSTDYKYEGAYVYTFEKEGSKDFVVEGTKAGKSKKVALTAKYEIGAPILNIMNCPTNVTEKSINISGTIYDAKCYASLTINGKEVGSAYKNSTEKWTQSYTLKEGANTFEFVLTNAAGKTTTATRTINFAAGGPALKITSCPINVTTKNITISGTMYDPNYTTSLTINGEPVATCTYADLERSWSKSYTLKEGKNTFEFELTNAAGKTTTETKVVNFSVGGPELKITSCPNNVTKKDITISGTMYDSNYTTSLTINGESVATCTYADYERSWSKSYTLKEGANTFEFVLTSAAGKTSTETRVVNFSVGGPELKITSCPNNVTKKDITISGTMYDSNYTTNLSINGESVASNTYADYERSWSKSYTLKEGANTFEFVLTNAAGKTTTETKTIYFSVGDPEIQFTNCPETTQQDKITITGKIARNNEGASLFINDKEAWLNSYYYFSETYTLSAGSNKFIFRAVNDYGKTVTITKTIIYSPEAT